MTTIVPTTTTHGSSDMATADVLAVANQRVPIQERREIHDATALTVASWYASPGNGRWLAALSQGQPVDLDDLLNDIRNERHRVTARLDEMCLDCLATWAINHPSRRRDR